MTIGSKRDDSPSTISSLFSTKRNRISDAFSFLNDSRNKQDNLSSENNSVLKYATSDNISSEHDNPVNNLTREERQHVEAFNRDLKLYHKRHQADAIALFSNTATNTMFIKNYKIIEWICESVAVLREGEMHVLLNLKGMNKYKKDLDIGGMENLEFVRNEIESGRGIEFMGRLLESNVYGTRTFRFV